MIPLLPERCSHAQEQYFELLGHYIAVDDWLERWTEEGWAFEVDKDVLDSARHLLDIGGGEFIIRETIRATSLNRLEGTEVQD